MPPRGGVIADQVRDIPLLVSGCITWLDFSDASKITTGGAHASGSGLKVTSMTDKSPLALTYTASGAAFLRTGVTGNVLPTCDNPTAGAQWALDSGAGLAATFGNPTAWTVFCAGIYTNTTGSARVFSIVTATGGTAADGVYYIPSGSAIWTQYDSISGTAQGNVGIGAGASEQFMFDVNTGGGGGSLVMRRGVDAASFSGTWPTGKTLDRIKISSGGADSWYGQLFCYIAYNTRLNTANRNLVQNYIKSSFATAN